MKTQTSSTPVSKLLISWVLMLPLWCFAIDGIPFFRGGTGDDTLVATFGTLGGAEGGTTDNIVLSALLFTILPLAFLFHIKGMWRSIRRDTIFLAMAILIAVSFTWSQFPIVSLEWAPLALINIATAFYLQERFTPDQQMRLLLMLGTVCLALSYGLIIVYPHFGIASTNQSIAWKGMYAQKNMCSMNTIFLLPAAFFIQLRSSLMKAFRVLYVALSILLVLGTRSATGKISLAALAVFLVLSSIIVRIRARERVVVLLVLTASGLAAVVTLLFAAQAIAPALGRDITLTGRTEIWAAILPAIWRRPLLGYGYHAFWRGYQGESASISLAAHWAVPSAHNGILEIWVTLGSVGVALLLLSLARALRDSARAFSGAPDRYTLWCSCLVFLMVVINIDEGEFFNPYGLMSMMFVLACLGLNRIRTELNSDKETARFPEPVMANS